MQFVTHRGESALEEIVRALNTCVEASTDGMRGYSMAAAEARDAGLKAAFDACSRQRGVFVLELQESIAKLGGRPEHHGTTMGTLRRSLMTVREMLEGPSDSIIVEECRRGDRAALRAYKAALRRLEANALSYEARAIIERQMTSIELSQMKTWRHRTT
jgi:uncharacterized protein (TIGR02284 family)